MTRKHFQALADALLALRPSADGPLASRYGPADGDTFRAALSIWRDMVRATADVCAAANGRFDRGHFEYAAGIR